MPTLNSMVSVITNPEMMDKLSFAPAVESVNIADFPSYANKLPLPEGKYYWRVDCYDKLTDPNVLSGPFWSFTATSTPVFNSITPSAQAKFEGQDGDPDDDRLQAIQRRLDSLLFL